MDTKHIDSSKAISSDPQSFIYTTRRVLSRNNNESIGQAAASPTCVTSCGACCYPATSDYLSPFGPAVVVRPCETTKRPLYKALSMRDECVQHSDNLLFGKQNYREIISFYLHTDNRWMAIIGVVDMKMRKLKDDNYWKFIKRSKIQHFLVKLSTKWPKQFFIFFFQDHQYRGLNYHE